MNTLRFLLLAALTTSALGCAAYQDAKYSLTHHRRTFVASMFASEVPFFDGDFKCGWRQGYYDFSMGRACKPPVVPDKKYWAACYQCPKGQKQIDQWYRGYQAGLIAAEKDCGDCWHRLKSHGLVASADEELPLVSNAASLPSVENIPAPEASNIFAPPAIGGPAVTGAPDESVRLPAAHGPSRAPLFGDSREATTSPGSRAPVPGPLPTSDNAANPQTLPPKIVPLPPVRDVE